MTVVREIIPWWPLGAPERHLWLVRRMTKACGVDASRAMQTGDLDIQEWSDMIHRCRSCTWVYECQKWLDRQRDAVSDVVPPTCMNSQTLHRLSERQHP